MFRSIRVLGLALVLSIAPALGALAADPADKPAVDEIVVGIGTRTLGRTVEDSPVPIDVLSETALESTGETEIGRMIQILAPSFNFSSSSISDGSDALRPATLRGLGPDQTLVLINGKRRHGSALIHVNTSVGRGTAGTDMNALPASSIQRIEVLRDGASAQYGSDAIAGVINLVLKDSPEEGRVSASYGEYTGFGDGETFVASVNKGFQLGEGFVNFALEYRDRGRTNRAGKSGACQYVGTCVSLGGGVNQTTDPREIAFNRTNFRIGDGDSEQWSFMANAALPITEDVEAYAFFTYSNRDNTTGGFYRRANQSSRNPTFLFDGVTPVNGGDAFFPDGFLPLINTEIDDLSINGGLRGELANGWHWDASVGYGTNDFAFDISNSINASLVSATGTSPTSADAGELSLGLFTADLDVFKEMDWGVLAGGVSYRRDEYEISAGSEVSYRDFDTINGMSLGPLDADAGIQVFPGFSPANEVDENRDSIAVYVDVEYTAIERLLLGAAVRFEDYSDFGSTLNAKGTIAYEVNDMVRVRGAVSTGFRAPSLQQQFFNNTSTQFVAGPMGGTIAQQRGTFRNDSAVAKAIGIPELEEETSVNYSVGFVLNPMDNLSFSLDYYNIQIDDRIVISGAIGTGLDPALDAALASAGASSAQFFLNAADTTTDGFDAVLDYTMDLMDGVLNLSASANITDTEIDSVVAPSALSSVPGIQNLVFTSQDRSIIETWQPHSRVNVTARFEQGPLTFLLTANRFGHYIVEEGNGARQSYSPKILLDTQVQYACENGLTLRAGVANIFDKTPDKNKIGQSRGGTIVDGMGNLVVDSPGVFKFSRRAAPFGFNGRRWYVAASYDF